MRIVNARLGFANNSSSSHSMIIVPKERYAGMSTRHDGDGYGWQDFTLADAGSKLDYLAHAVWGQLRRSGSEEGYGGLDPAAIVVRDLFGIPDWRPRDQGIDHQSSFELPGSPDGDLIDVGFARAFARWIQSEGVVVLGGNDNGGPHPLSDGSDALPFGREETNRFVAKFDEKSATWTLFNAENGAKLRMAFSDGEAVELEQLAPPGSAAPRGSDPAQAGGEPPKTGTPELVDVKITDFCDIGCGYCYQGSTPEGRHAKIEDIRILAREFFKAGVLEVAIGGGEPTRHPRFPEILEAFAVHGIVANFTTRDLGFLKDGLLRARVLGASKSVAVSISSLAQMQEAKALWSEASPHGFGSSIAFQYVMGTASDQEFERILTNAVRKGDALTLLGYKDSGRGLQWREGAGRRLALREAKVQSQSGDWLDIARRALEGGPTFARVCIDTALARECESALALAGVDRRMWHKSEGLVSMYVDAVAMAMGKSSYEPEQEMEPFDASWRERFASWEPTSDKPARARGTPGALHV